MSIDVFIAFAYEDDKLRQELENHLSILRRRDVIVTRHARQIQGGQETQAEIEARLDAAQVILLLVSADFLASDDCYNHQLQRAIERHKAGTARVIPVLLRPVDWKGAPFGKLQPLPRNGKPVTSWANRDEALKDIAQEIRRAIEERQDINADIAALVQEVREKVQGDIQRRCGTMRVLDMEQPIGLTNIYTKVNFLQKISGRRRLSVNELLQEVDPKNFDRFGLSQATEKRVPGLEAVEREPHLVVLGGPGAGKTTFLKYLGTQCSQNQFYADLVPVFVSLKDFAETSNKPELLSYIAQAWTQSGIENSETKLKQVLGHGKCLVLLDGLDEVRKEDSQRVLKQIEELSNGFHQNRFVMTCRIAAKEYHLPNFTEVEVASFDDEQVAKFAENWFACKNAPQATEQFLERLSESEPIRELGSNPLLLTLLCLEFGDSGSFPENRSELYERATATLLRKWDDKRQIRRDQVYKQLSVKRKEDLLSQIALMTFESKDYFFKRRQVGEHITGYIRNLPDARNDTEALQADSEVVLKSIEAQHGLIVERAVGIYSFSHLTFQEYFAARKSIANSESLKCLAQHVGETRWREVFLLATGMMQDASELARMMKRQVDAIMASDEQLQGFLAWVNQKSTLASVYVFYKPVAVRAFYFSLASARALALARDLDLALDCALKLDFASALAHDLASALAHDLDLALAGALNCALNRNFNLDLARTLDLHLARELALARNLDLDLALNLDLDLNTQLRQALQTLKDQLPNLQDWKRFRQWWQTNGQAWIQQLRAAMIEHRNVGHDWQFSEEQEKVLQQYYEANKLLVDCLNSDCYVSREVRQEIEETLLLPMAEIEGRS
ncbi:NACHT C-terminal helical domain 2-containing protein [Leptolyngbya sp. FACHB-261]|uniref:NACHT C-terminal helical domain 2-containing protein n=1 Tax=Leptolyngbya sp. FACHB-261 TaxID=2692806 RepID=UPI00168936F4|nr:NACHT domain-containing protein [Leptolyngbya sp. FACHB-261]MBD2100155.1 NACHT domain-containing protein [Leptolyngbya sp. FACHB-261]